MGRNMPAEKDNDDAPYNVVINQEEQYSIWPAGKTVPSGWEAIGEPRIKVECLAYIEQIWTDMRPLSLRVQMNAAKISK
jgi:MbtH protein